jgi:hypothetical protein
MRSADDVTAAIERLIDANRTLRSQLLTNERILVHALQLITDGAGVGHTLMSVPSVRDRRAAEEAVRSLYEARHKVREAIIPAAIADGLGVGEVAEAFGIPLESVVAYASEVTAGPL